MALVKRGWRAVLGVKLELAAMALLLATFAAIHYQDRILDRTVVVSPGNAAPEALYWYGDQANGGTSTATADSSEPLRWTCQLESTYQYPHCSYGVLLGTANRQGLDLSKFSSLSMDLVYEGPSKSLRVHLKNRDRRYSRPGAAETDKFNKIDVELKPGSQTINLDLASFSVADWWVDQNRVPHELSHPQFDNVVAVEVQTGAAARMGLHVFQIRKITLKGVIMTQGQWYSVIFGCWLLLIGVLLFHRRKQARVFQETLVGRWSKTLDTIPQMVWSTAPDGTEYYNAQWLEFTGHQVGNAHGVPRAVLIHPDDQAMALARWEHSLSTGKPYEAEYRMRHQSGEYRWLLSRGLPERDAGGDVIRWYGTCTDIHERVSAMQALDDSESLNRGIINAIPDCVSLFDWAGIRIFANQATMRAHKVASPDGFLGEHLLDRVPPEVLPYAQAALAKAQNGQIGRLTVLGRDARWWDTIIAPVMDKSGNPLRIAVVARDITEQKNAERKAQWSANHDSLTRLPNRLVLQQHIDEAIAGTAGRPRSFAVLLLDIDDFKKINDTAGHDAGDALLCAFADRLLGAVRSEDTVARLGGDEFAVLLSGIGCEQELSAAVDTIFARLREPCIHGGRLFDCKASIGASFYPAHGAHRTQLLKNADVALYAAKSSGKGNLKIFMPAMRAEMQKRDSMISLAKDALKHKRVAPHYQPIINLRSGTPVGFEALLRWRHPRMGIQMPNLISAAFEDPRLAAEISDCMIDGVIADVRTWQDRDIPFGYVAINAAAAEFRRGDFAERLLERLHASSIPAEAIQLEVTETVFLGRGAECVERALKTLSAAGIRIALDDFGTGYASLSHLKQFPVDIIKIDRSFVSELEDRPDNAPITDAVINLGRSLGIKVVAEGIETAAQHDYLLARGCDLGQGFFYSPAVPARQAAALVKGLNRRAVA